MMECGLLAPPVPESATPQMDPARNLGAVECIQRVRTSSIISAGSRNFYPDECTEKELQYIIQYTTLMEFSVCFQRNAKQ